MSKKLIDIDDQALEEARRILGTSTYRETVNAGLREIIATQARRRQVERLLDDAPQDIEDTEITDTAWR